LKIKSGCIVELTYQLKNKDGEVVEKSDEDGPMNYLHGFGEIPTGLEDQLDGVEEGAELEITLAPGEAYGDYNPDGIVSVPRSEFPEDAEIVPGDWIAVTVAEDGAEAGAEPGPESGAGAAAGEEGEEAETSEVEMRVIEISPDAIVLDANHPLAGQQVTFDLRVVSVRQASAEEIAERQAAATAEEEEES
jgi:FKBP-type peptidyl-prolyl cis-trans isomerase SlyD